MIISFPVAVAAFSCFSYRLIRLIDVTSER